MYSDVVVPVPSTTVLHNESANPSDTSADPGNETSGFDFWVSVKNNSKMDEHLNFLLLPFFPVQYAIIKFPTCLITKPECIGSTLEEREPDENSKSSSGFFKGRGMPTFTVTREC